MNEESQISNVDNLISTNEMGELSSVSINNDNTNYNEVISVEDNSTENLNIIDEEKIADANINDIYVSPNGTGDGSSIDKPTNIDSAITTNLNNAIIHFADGDYTKTKATTLSKKENIVFKAENSGKVTISHTASLFTFTNCNNITVRGINFINTGTAQFFSGTANITIDKCSFKTNKAISTALNFQGGNIKLLTCNFTGSIYNSNMIIFSTDGNVEISNCTFENITHNSYSTSILQFNMKKPNVIIDSCNFSNIIINTNNYRGIIVISTTNSTFDIKNNIFEIPQEKLVITASTLTGISHIALENNIINSNYAFDLISTRSGAYVVLDTPVTFTILNNTVVETTVGENVLLTAVLVDDMGNKINYNGLQFVIGENNYTPTFNNMTGEYYYLYTPENSGSIEISAKSDKISEDDWTIEKGTLNVKASPELTLDFTNITYGEAFNVNVTLKEDALSNVTFTVKKSDEIIETKEAVVTSGFAGTSFENLQTGEYTISVSYPGDDNYGKSSISNTFKVDKATSTIVLVKDNVSAIKENDQVGFYFTTTNTEDKNTITITLPTGATGTLTFKINTSDDIKTIAISDTVSKVLFDILEIGNYTITVSYNGDDNYNPTTEEYNFTLVNDKESADLTLNFTNTTYNNIFNVNVTINGEVTGSNIIFEVRTLDGNLINQTTSTITDKFASTSFSGLNAGEYNVVAIYEGDDTYSNTAVSTPFKVDKIDLESFNLNAEKIIVVFDKINVSALIPVNVNGNVTFKLEGVEETVDLANNEANYTFNGLSEGNYTIYATFNGDNNYNSHEEQVNISVVKVNSTLNVEYSTINVGENVTISINLENDINDEITIKINNEDEIKRTLVNGSATYTIEKIPGGEYNITITYNGNDKYYSSVNTTLFTVNKLDTNPIISYDDPVLFGDVNVTVTITGASGSVNFTINDATPVSKELVDGVATYTFTNISAGTYNINVTYSGDDYYLGSVNSTSLTVEKINSTITFNNEIIFVYGESGSTTIELDGATVNKDNITIIEDNDTIITFSENTIGVSNLSAGKYTLKVITSPDENHLSVEGLVNITVSQAKSSVEITTNNGVYNTTNASVNINVNNETTLSFNITAGDDLVFASDDISVLNSTVAGLGAGVYNVTVLNSESKNFQSASDVKELTITKAASLITITPIEAVDYNTTIAVTYNVLNATTVSYTVKKGEIVVVPNTTVTDGIVIPVLDAGEYTLIINNAENDNYTADSKEAPFTINKAKSSVAITVNNGVFNTISASVDINVINQTSLSFNITVGDTVISTSTDITTLNTTVAGLGAGVYNVTVLNSENDNFQSSSDVKELTISKAYSLVNITPIEAVDYNNTITVTYSVLNATNVTYVVKKGDEIIIDTTQAPETILIPVLDAGEYSLIINNAENENYTADSKQSAFTINKINPTVTFSNNIIFRTSTNGSTNITVTDGVEVVLSVNSTGAVVERVGNVVTVSNLPAGLYTLNATTTANTNYNSIEVTLPIKVNDNLVNPNFTILLMR